MVYTWALKWLPYYDLRAHVYTIKLHGAFGYMPGSLAPLASLWKSRLIPLQTAWLQVMETCYVGSWAARVWPIDVERRKRNDLR